VALSREMLLSFTFCIKKRNRRQTGRKKPILNPKQMLKTEKCTVGELPCRGEEKKIHSRSVPCGRAAEVWRIPNQNITESLLMFIVICSRTFHTTTDLYLYSPF